MFQDVFGCFRFPLLFLPIVLKGTDLSILHYVLKFCFTFTWTSTARYPQSRTFLANLGPVNIKRYSTFIQTVSFSCAAYTWYKLKTIFGTSCLHSKNSSWAGNRAPWGLIHSSASSWTGIWVQNNPFRLIQNWVRPIGPIKSGPGFSRV